MTQKMQKAHGQDVIDLMREHNLFAVDTLFKPKRKMWNGRYRYCNATYLPKDREKRPTKLDYICVTDRWKSMIIDSKVRWGPSIHRFGQTFDHRLLIATWRWKTKKDKKPRRPDYTLMTEEAWPNFDRALRIKLRERSKQLTNSNGEDTASANKDNDNTELAKEFKNLTKCVYDTIQEVVPEKKWLRKNGRVVTEATKRLFEPRKRISAKEAYTAEEKRMKQDHKQCMQKRLQKMGGKLGTRNREIRRKGRYQSDIQRRSSPKWQVQWHNREANDEVGKPASSPAHQQPRFRSESRRTNNS